MKPLRILASVLSVMFSIQLSFSAGDAATHCEAKGRKKLNCVLCEKSFTATLDLDIHVRAHPEVVQFVLELADAEPRNDEGVAETVLEEVAVPFATQVRMSDAQTSATETAVVRVFVSRNKREKKKYVKDIWCVCTVIVWTSFSQNIRDCNCFVAEFSGIRWQSCLRGVRCRFWCRSVLSVPWKRKPDICDEVCQFTKKKLLLPWRHVLLQKSVSNDRSLQTTPATKGKSKRRKRGRPPHGLCPKSEELKTLPHPLANDLSLIPWVLAFFSTKNNTEEGEGGGIVLYKRFAPVCLWVGQLQQAFRKNLFFAHDRCFCTRS